MIFDLIQIYRARRDRALTSKLAARFAHGQLLDRATAPLLLVHLCLWAAVIIMSFIFALILAAAIKTHWTIGVIGTAPLAIGFACGWVSVRLKKSLDQIRAMAAQYSDTRIDNLLNRNPVKNDALGNIGVNQAADAPQDNSREAKQP
jgi:hypothetical protein